MSRDDLIARLRGASGPRPQAVTVPGLGEVFVRVMTPFDSETARLAMQRHAGKQDGLETGRLLASILCDAEGVALFDVDADAEVMVLAKLPAEAASAIFKAHRAANGVAENAAEAEALGKA